MFCYLPFYSEREILTSGGGIQMKDNNHFQLNIKSGGHCYHHYLPIDVSSALQVECRAMEYINNCIYFNTYPTVIGLCNALGINRRTFHRWECGLYRAKTHQALAVKYKNLLEELLETRMVEGEIHPISGIFMLKNNFGYSDKYEYEIAPSNQLYQAPITEDIYRNYSCDNSKNDCSKSEKENG